MRMSSRARETFLYLLMFVSLAISAIAVGGSYFAVIDNFVRDPLNPFGSYRLSSLRWQLAAVIVASPVFSLAARAIKRAIRGEPALRRSGIRKWVLYLALFVAAAVIIGDLIGVLGQFFDGDLTLRFSLKALTVLVIAALVIGYYWIELKQDEAAGATPHSSGSN